jgi:hypothetical protein
MRAAVVVLDKGVQERHRLIQERHVLLSEEEEAHSF